MELLPNYVEKIVENLRKDYTNNNTRAGTRKISVMDVS